MEILNKDSALVTSDKLDLFTVPPTVIPSVEWIKRVPVCPIGDIRESRIIEFYIPGSVEDYIDLSGIKVEIEAKILKAADSSDLLDADLDKVTLTELPLDGNFSNVEVSLNERVIENSNNLRAWQIHTQMLCNDDENAIKSERSVEGVYWNSPGKSDSLTKAENSAIDLRKIYTKQEFRLRGPLRIGICQQHKLLIPGVSLRIKFLKNEQAHMIVTTTAAKDDYKYNLNKVSLIVPYVRLIRTASEAVEEKLRESRLVYSFERIRNSYVSIPKAETSYISEGIYSGEFLLSILFIKLCCRKSLL